MATLLFHEIIADQFSQHHFAALTPQCHFLLDDLNIVMTLTYSTKKLRFSEI